MGVASRARQGIGRARATEVPAIQQTPGPAFGKLGLTRLRDIPRHQWRGPMHLGWKADVLGDVSGSPADTDSLARPGIPFGTVRTTAGSGCAFHRDLDE